MQYPKEGIYKNRSANVASIKNRILDTNEMVIKKKMIAKETGFRLVKFLAAYHANPAKTRMDNNVLTEPIPTSGMVL